MKPCFSLLFQSLHRASDPIPSGLPTALISLPPVGALPSPWTTWLLITLMEYRERQRWGKELLRKSLRQTVPPSKSLRKREQPVVMRIPDMPEWEVRLECESKFGWLIHQVTGEMISVGLMSQNVEPIIFADALNRYVKPTSRWEPAGRLFELHPDFNSIWYAIDDLVAAKLLEAVHYDLQPYKKGLQPDGHRLTVVASSKAAIFSGFFARWPEAGNQLWLSALIGDWLLADELARANGDPGLVEITASRAEECRQRRIRRIRRRMEKHGTTGWELKSLYQLGEKDVTSLVRQALRGGSYSVAAAINFLASHDDPSLAGEVFDAWDRLWDAREGLLGSGTLESTQWLLEHGHRTEEVIEAICSAEQVTDEAALMVLEHAPRRAIPVIRRALRNERVGAGNETTAALALIDRPWSREELRTILEEWQYRDSDELLPFIVALQESADPEARTVGDEWGKRCDPRLIGCERDSLHFEMERIRDRVARLRDRTPAEM